MGQNTFTLPSFHFVENFVPLSVRVTIITLILCQNQLIFPYKMAAHFDFYILTCKSTLPNDN